MEVLQDSQKFRVGIRMLYPYPHPHLGVFQGHTRTPGIVPRAYRYFIQAPGTGMNVVQNLQKLRYG